MKKKLYASRLRFPGFHRRFFLSLIFLMHMCIHLGAAQQSEWTILVYAQANNSLSSFAYKNFNDMATIGTEKHVNVLVQWYKSGEQGTFRYKIEKGKIALDECIQSSSDGNKSEDLIGAMRWAVKKYPAKKYCLVLWNHGIGILDPVWGNSMMMVNPRFIRNNPRIQIPGITVAENDLISLAADPTVSDSLFEAVLHRGILFNERTKTYMNNQSLHTALSEIKKNVLKNKKIDILGMDACLMAMIEVGYQVKDFATYMVGSQEVELAYGWNYKALLQAIGIQKATSLQVVQSIVLAYEELYKKQIQFYTQSAIDLNNVGFLRQSIDNVVRNMLVCYELDKRGFAQVVKGARAKCLRFSTPSYIDFHSFLQELLQQIYLVYEKNNTARKNQRLQKAVDTLKNATKVASAIVEDTVVAHVCGRYYMKAKGLSIYFPLKAINASYAKTEFAKDSLWYGFLKKAVHW